METKETEKKVSTIKSSKAIGVVLATSMSVVIGLFFFIPYITESYTINTIVRQSINSAEQIKLTRAYYSKNVVKDVKKFAPQMSFSYNHGGANGVLPLPTTLIHDLSKVFSEKTGLKYQLYSEYPFKNRSKRKLTPFQKEAIKYTQKHDDGIYVKRDILDGKEVVRVATTDFMTDKTCVNCHNNHFSRTWEKGKWSIGDKRGVLEVITPLEAELDEHALMRNYIILFILGMSFLAFLYLWFSRSKKL